MLKYFITDPRYNLNEIKKAIARHKPDFVCYRNKEYFNEKEIIEFITYAKNYSKTFINYDSLKKEHLLNYFDGIHLPSSKINKLPLYTNKTVITSTHTVEEVIKAAASDYITFSPVFDSKGRKGLGIEKLNEICRYHGKVIALGGIIGEKEVKKIENSNAVGFAGIRYFFT